MAKKNYVRLTIAEREIVLKRLAEGNLKIPDTWEVGLSGGAGKKETFTRLLQENNLGAMAFLRNLRNMIESGVDDDLIRESFRNVNPGRVLPFRFIAAAQHALRFEPELERLMMECLAGKDKIPGKTVLLVDVSASMDWQLSERSTLPRMAAGIGLAILVRELFPELSIYSFSNEIHEIPPRRGFALGDAIHNSQVHYGTYLGAAVKAVSGKYERIIVITDEQSHDPVPDPTGKYNYMINIASNENGVGYGAWTHIDGWSEAVIDYIINYEKMERV